MSGLKYSAASAINNVRDESPDSVVETEMLTLNRVFQEKRYLGQTEQDFSNDMERYPSS